MLEAGWHGALFARIIGARLVCFIVPTAKELGDVNAKWRLVTYNRNLHNREDKEARMVRFGCKISSSAVIMLPFPMLADVLSCCFDNC